MQINGIPETSGGTEILSFSWGASNPVVFGGGGGSAGKVSISSFNIMKHQDASTIRLIRGVATGENFKDAVFTIFDEKGTPSFRYTLQGVIIESLQHSGSACGDKKCTSITESVSIAAANWKWENLITGQSHEYKMSTF